MRQNKVGEAIERALIFFKMERQKRCFKPRAKRVLEEPAEFIYGSAEQVLEECVCIGFFKLHIVKQVVLKLCKFVI